MQDKLSPQRDDQKMTAIAPNDARRFVRSQLEEIAVTRKPGESIKAMLVRIARVAGLDFSRTRKLWYGEVDNIPWHEAETIRQRAQQVRERWEMMQRRQLLASAQTDLKRTQDYGDEIARRREVSRRAHLDRPQAQMDEQFHFWLGRPDSDLDREE